MDPDRAGTTPTDPAASRRTARGRCRRRPATRSRTRIRPWRWSGSHALRGARARTGMTEQQVVAKLAEQGFAITVDAAARRGSAPA